MIRQSITSSHNARLKAAIALQSGRSRKQQQRIIIFGQREVERALQAGLAVVELFVCQEVLPPDWLPRQEAALRSGPGDTAVFDLSPDLFRKIAYGDRLDGVAAVALRPPTDLDLLQPGENPLVLVLESVEKPGNLGAVIRSADGAGASAVIAADPATDFFHPNSIRSSVASVFSLPIAAATAGEVGDWLALHRFQTILAAPGSERTFFDIDLTGRVAIVLGNEARGISPFWNSVSGVRSASLPMLGSTDSLNISAAATAILYLAACQRRVGF